MISFFELMTMSASPSAALVPPVDAHWLVPVTFATKTSDWPWFAVILQLPCANVPSKEPPMYRSPLLSDSISEIVTALLTIP